jgi:transcriptional regulator with XRE-family HTH domain
MSSSQCWTADMVSSNVRWATMLGDLLSLASRWDGTVLAEALQRNLRRGMDLVGGKIKDFALLCGSKYHLFDLECKKRLSMDVLMRICERLDMPLTVLFDLDSASCEKYWLNAVTRIKTLNIADCARRSAIQVKRLLQEAACEEPARSLKDVARKLGYKSSVMLWRTDRESCKQISARITKPFGGVPCERLPRESLYNGAPRRTLQ